MKRAWFGLTGIATLLAAAAPAWAWNSISVPGNIFTNAQWTPETRYLTSHSGSVWSGDVAVDQQGDFKFAANGNWTTSWGGIGVSPVILRLPATGVGPLTSADGKNIALKAIDAPQTLHFSFDDTNLVFSVTGPAAPAVTNAQLVGVFNDYGASSAGTLANSSGSIWTADIPLTSGASLALRVNGEDQAWGTPFPVSPDLPATLPLCGDNSFTLPDFRPGTFRATFDADALTLKLEQIATNTFVRAGIAAEGPLNALWASRRSTPSPQDVNLAPDGSSYVGSFWINAPNTSFTLSFSERDASGNRGGLYWSAPSAASVNISSTPHTNTWIAVTNARSVVSNTFTAPAAGLYEISLTPSSGALSVRRRYATNDNVNLFKDPSLESGSNWSFYNARRYDARDGGDDEPPAIHAGNGVAALLQRRTEEGDYGSVSQWIPVSTNYAGSTLRVSAWLCAFGEWTASRTRIWIQWQDASGNPVGSEKETVLSNIPSTWTPYSVDAEIPEGAVRANVLFAYNGANDGGGYLLVDDAEARIASSRRLDFNTWTKIASSTSFGSYAPDWSISRGRTTNNLSDAHLDPGALFISKYIEGSNNNKAIELFNPTTAPIDLSGWNLEQYDNGSPTASVSFALSGTIATGACFLITRTFDDPVPLSDTLKNASDKQFYGLTFNGDDAIVLVDPSGNIADRVGQVRSDVTGSLLAYVMRDHTLVRSPYTARGTTDGKGNDFPYDEWEILPCDDFTDLKSHTRSLPPDLYLPSGLSLVLANNATLTSPRLDGGIGDVSFWYRTAFPESAGIAATNSATLVVEASSSENFASVTTLGTVVIPADQYDFKQFSVLADLADATYFRIRSTDVTGNAFARIDDLSVGETLPISRYQDFNVWTNADWAAYIGKYSLGGWTLADGRTTIEGGISGTAAAVLPNGATVVSPALDTGAGLVYFWTSAADPDDDSYAIAVEKSTDGGVKWSQVASFTGSGASNWVSRTLAASASADVVLRFVSTGTGPVLVDNIRIELPEEASRNQDFNSWPVSSGYTSESYQGWVSSSGMIAADSGVDGTRGFRAKAANASILSPALDGGLGIVSFVARPYSSSHSPAFKVEVSRDGGTKWETVLTNRLDGASAGEWTSFEVAVNDETVTHVRIVNTMAQTICIDSIVCGKIVPPPSMNIIPGLDPAVPYPDEAFRFSSFVNPVGGATRADIVSVTAGYTFVPAGQKPQNGSVELEFDASSGAYYSPDFPGLADGSRIVFSNVVVWTSNGTQIATASQRTTVYVSSTANSGVWINEVFYSLNSTLDGGGWGGDWTEGGDWGGFWDEGTEDHEFIEICGPANTDLDGWSLELQFAYAKDMAANGGKATYATYSFTTNNTAPASALRLSDQKDGYGFFVVGDPCTNWTVNVAFTNLVPPTKTHSTPELLHDHFYNGAGVILLKNKQGVTVHSVSYDSEEIPNVTDIGQQSAFDVTDSLAATGGPGYCATNFSWTNSIGVSAGAANSGQSFTNHATTSKIVPYAFHVPSLHIVPDKATSDEFDMLDPWPPTIATPVAFHLAYPASYPEGTFIVHTRPLGDGGYDDHDDDAGLYVGATSGTNAFMRWRMKEPPYTNGWKRLSTIQYYFTFNPDRATYATVYIGVDGNGDSHVYESEEDAAGNPFTYTFIFHGDYEFVSLADFKAALKDAGREGEYPFTDTVSFPADPEAPSKLVFFDPDVTCPPEPTELSLETAGTLLSSNAWHKLSDVGIDCIRPDINNVSSAVNGRYFFLEFFPTSSPSFFRAAPKAQIPPGDLSLD